MKRLFAKRIAAAAAAAIIAVCSISVKAAGTPAVNIQMKGNFQVGQEIELDINISNIDAFYAGAVDLKLDPTVVQLLDIEKGSFIDGESINIIQPYKDVFAEEGRARYGFTCTGPVKGFSGSGTFVKIKAKVLKKGSLSIKNILRAKEFSKDNNIVLQIVDGAGQPVEIDYSFAAFEYNAEGNQTSAGTNSSTGTNSSGTSSNTANTSNTNTTNNPTNNPTNNSKSEEPVKPGISKEQQVSKKNLEKETSAQKKSIPMAFAAGTVALVVAAGVSYFIIVRRKKAKMV